MNITVFKRPRSLAFAIAWLESSNTQLVLNIAQYSQHKRTSEYIVVQPRVCDACLYYPLSTRNKEWEGKEVREVNRAYVTTLRLKMSAELS